METLHLRQFAECDLDLKKKSCTRSWLACRASHWRSLTWNLELVDYPRDRSTTSEIAHWKLSQCIRLIRNVIGRVPSSQRSQSTAALFTLIWADSTLSCWVWTELRQDHTFCSGSVLVRFSPRLFLITAGITKLEALLSCSELVLNVFRTKVSVLKVGISNLSEIVPICNKT